MFTKKNDEPTALAEEISRLHLELKNLKPGSEEYTAVMDQIVQLYKVQEAMLPDRVSADTKAIITANLAGIFLMMNHERTHVIATKALGFIRKLS